MSYSLKFHYKCEIIVIVKYVMADIKNLLKGVQENILLAPYTTFKIGGPARYFFVAKTVEDIKKAVQVAKELKLPYYIIGNGSNILVSDRGFDGLAIRIMSYGLKITGQKIFVESGFALGKIVMDSVKGGLSGLEWLIGIPGTVGGAISGNAGAYGHSIGDTIESVKILNADSGKEDVLSGKECSFSYRHSIFKEKKYIILSAILKLKKGDKKESEKKIKEYISKRQGKHPVGPSAGSVFKNPLIIENQKVFEKLVKKYPEIEKFKVTGRIPAGWLVEEYGLLGKKIGGAMISKEHGNFIINAGGANAEDVIMLISLIKQKIRVNFGIQMEEEIRYVGF